MTMALRRSLSLAGFLDWERQRELKDAFEGIQPIARNGGTVAHSVIPSNVFRAFDKRLVEPCRVYRGDLKLILGRKVRYPDAIVSCAPVRSSEDFVPEPLIVFAVLSPSPRLIDETVKAMEYTAMTSIQNDVMVK